MPRLHVIVLGFASLHIALAKRGIYSVAAIYRERRYIAIKCLYRERRYIAINL